MAVDVDGTLLTSAHRVSPRTEAAVAAVRARGVRVLLATSRGPVALRPVVTGLGLVGEPVIASQGALTGYFRPSGAFHAMERDAIGIDDARSAVALALAHGFAVSWYTADAWLVSGIDATIDREAAVVGVSPLVRDLLAESGAPEKIMVVSGGASLDRLRAALPPGVSAQTSNPTYLEITRRGVDKGAALRRYRERHAIPRADVLAIGDGPNDAGMFAVAGRSVAMGNAAADLRRAADAVTASNDDDGVALVLEALATK